MFGCGVYYSGILEPEPSESERFDIALKDRLDPNPMVEEVVETCAAMESVAWDSGKFFNEDTDRRLRK